jgi:hypothetical protein
MPNRLYQLVPIIVLLSGVTAAALAQSPAGGDANMGTSKPTVRPGFSLFQKKNVDTADSNTSGKGKAGNPSPNEQEQPAPWSRETELESLFRREAVCLRLQELALRTGDDKLWRRANELSAMASQAYAHKVAQQPANLTRPPSDDMRNRNLGKSTAGTDSADSLPLRGSGFSGPFSTRKGN